CLSAILSRKSPSFLPLGLFFMPFSFVFGQCWPKKKRAEGCGSFIGEKRTNTNQTSKSIPWIR
ncbi:MAG: hypothetical protein WCT05_06115, partial [Lentisphaeria bacterium]